MEMNQLRYFLAVAQEGSFTKAAASLHVSQPALSKSIRKLEEELECKLFERRGQFIELSLAGELFFTRCGSFLEQLDGSVDLIREAIGLEKGHVRMAITSGVTINHLIFTFLKQYPEVTFSMQLMNIPEISRALADGTIDFALSDAPVLGEGIEWEPLYCGSLTCILNPDDPLAKVSSIHIEDLKEHRFCIGQVSSNLYTKINELFFKAGFEPRIRYAGYDPDLAGTLIMLPGSAIISHPAIDSGVRDAKTDAMPPGGRQPVVVPLANTDGLALIGLSKKSGHFQTKASHAFADRVRHYYAAIESNTVN